MATPEQPDGEQNGRGTVRTTNLRLGGNAPTLSSLTLWSMQVLAVGWLSCVVLAWVPLVVAVLLIGLVEARLNAGSYSLLRIGGFAPTDQRFLRWCVFGIHGCSAGAGAFATVTVARKSRASVWSRLT